tara:strand:- start:4261 stop:5496 length:1236 start_codon:yes stop_codon:yes gene_type:complete
MISDSKLQQMSKGEARADDITDLLDVNDLVYELPKNLSLAAARNTKEYHFQKSEYTNGDGSMICTLQTGGQYVNWAASHLKFKLTRTSTGTSDWGKGSAANIFREVIITSRSGQEIARLDRSNVYRLHHDRLYMSAEELASVGSLMGYDEAAVATGVPGTYIIPMCKICTLFDNKKLMPNWLASGLRIELRLESPATAFDAAAATAVTAYTIKDPKIIVDTFLLNDSAMKKLNEISARNALEYVYKSVHCITDSFSTGDNTIDINKAVSRALGAMAVSRRTANIANATVDSLKSEGFDFEHTQFRLGSQYYPQQPLQGLEEHYWNTLYTSEKLKSSHPSSVSKSDYNTDYGVTTTNLERSNVLDLSGQPINNSMTLSCELKYLSSASRRVCVFLEYVIVSKIYVNNVSVVV